MAYNQSDDIDSTTDLNKYSVNEPEIISTNPNEIPTINSTNPNYQSVSSTTSNNSWETSNPVVDSLANQGKAELKKGQQQAEDIITKSKKVLKQHCKLNASKFVNIFPCP
jgi:hypothetical protein